MSEIKRNFFQFLILLFCLDSSLGQKCGISDNSTRIVGGEDAGPLKWPWMAYIKITLNDTELKEIYTSTCGGTLISDEWVLTAAHCLVEDDPEIVLINVEVTLGEHDTTKSDGTEVVIKSSKNIIHESYDQKTVKNDIAVIKLKTKLDFKGKHKYLQPICLPQKDIKVDPKQCWATGWGVTTDGGKVSDILQEVKLPILCDEYCKVKQPDIDSKKQLCAGYTKGGRAPCYGDSGGPLQCELADNVWVQQGIVSYGGSRCADKKPDVLTRVSAYLPWIKSNTGIK